jgi:hypothetical protein
MSEKVGQIDPKYEHVQVDHLYYITNIAFSYLNLNISFAKASTTTGASNMKMKDE